MSKLFAKGLPGRKKVEPVVSESTVEPVVDQVPKAKPRSSARPGTTGVPVRRAAARKPPAATQEVPVPEAEYKKPGDWFLNTEWKSRLRSFVKEVLVTHVYNGDPSQAQEFFKFLDSDSNFFPFFTAFVHYSVDRNTNYDRLEIVGDSAMKTSFIRYLYAQDIKQGYDLTEEGINDYVTIYLGKAELKKFSKIMEFPKYVLVKGNYPSDVGEDVFEAFVGAMVSSGELFSNGYGFYICQRFVDSVTKNIMNLKFSKEERSQTFAPKTWFKEIYDIILPVGGAAELDSLVVEDETSTRSDISLKFVLKPGALLDLIKQHADKTSAVYPNYVVATADGYRGQEKKEVEVQLYQNARKVFIDWGFDDDFIRKLRLEKILAGMPIDDRRKYVAKLVKEQFVSVLAKTDTKVSSPNDYTINLIGIRRVDKTKKPNSTLEFEDVFLDSFRFKGNRKLDEKDKKKEIIWDYLKKRY